MSISRLIESIVEVHEIAYFFQSGWQFDMSATIHIATKLVNSICILDKNHDSIQNANYSFNRR